MDRQIHHHIYYLQEEDEGVDENVRLMFKNLMKDDDDVFVCVFDC